MAASGVLYRDGMEATTMCGARIIEGTRSCRVICECGFDRVMYYAPDTCPECHGHWDSVRFEEQARPGKVPTRHRRPNMLVQDLYHG